MYADKETAAMRTALDETERRRAIQRAYNEQHGITPETIVKGISDISEFLMAEGKVPSKRGRARRKRETDMSPAELESTIVELEEEMLAAAEDLRFEYAARLRDEIRDLQRALRDIQAYEAPA
jgi:excinuclease ABC subunit B